MGDMVRMSGRVLVLLLVMSGLLVAIGTGVLTGNVTVNLETCPEGDYLCEAQGFLQQTIDIGGVEVPYYIILIAVMFVMVLVL